MCVCVCVKTQSRDGGGPLHRHLQALSHYDEEPVIRRQLINRAVPAKGDIR